MMQQTKIQHQYIQIHNYKLPRKRKRDDDKYNARWRPVIRKKRKMMTIETQDGVFWNNNPLYIIIFICASLITIVTLLIQCTCCDSNLDEDERKRRRREDAKEIVDDVTSECCTFENIEFCCFCDSDD